MTRRPGRLSRLPLRIRLVAGFSAAMLVVLAGAGGFVYWRVEYALDRDLNAELSHAAGVLAPLVAKSGTVSDDSVLQAAGDTYQVLDRNGHVLDADPTLGTAPLLDTAGVRAALDHPIRRNIGPLFPVSSRPLRVYATPLPSTETGRAAVLVVATRRDHRDEALRELLGQLLAAGLGALLITAVVGERLAQAALRPVERYRAQAADIAAGATGVRLDVPAGRDDEITRLGHTLNSVLSALEDALQHERRFVNDASHELRTPLTLLRSRVQLALRRPRSVAQHEEVLAEIGTDVERLARLADQLLAVGTQRGDLGETGPTDLSEVARSAAESRHALASPDTPYSAAGSLRVVADGPAIVAVGSTRLSQVLANLLDNAATHGEPPVTVTVGTVTTQAGAEVVRLTVTDAGPGMDAETLETASQRFARAPRARARPGAGLGLSLVEAIVTGAGGELRVCSHGRHHRTGNPMRVDCDHDDAITVTVLLPGHPGL